MDRHPRESLPTLLAFGLLLAGAPSVPAHVDTPMTPGYATPVIDGARGPGEWDEVVPRAVFTGLSGSLLYVLNDGANLYLALWVPDPTLTIVDQFRVRIDSDHDGVNAAGDDELGVTGTGLFFDLHFANGFWNQGDAFSDGSAAVGAVDGGGFFELSHPLDIHDMSVSPGDTIGLCVRYNQDGMTSVNEVYPFDCMNSLNQQSLYVDVATSTGAVDAGPGLGGAGGLAAFPNPARLGSAMEIRFHVPARGADVDIALYAITGAKVGEVVTGRFEAGPQSVRWSVPERAAGKLAPGVYFLRARYDGAATETRTLLLR